MKGIKLNSNLVPIFTGTYGTIWGDDEYCSYSKYFKMPDIVEAYDNWSDEILDTFKESGLNIKDLKITGEFNSPKFYNYSTDTIDFNITVSETFERDFLKKLSENLEDFKKYLHDNFTSCDGFWSYTPNNWEDFKHEVLNKGEEYDQSVGAGITYLVGEESLSNLEYYIYGEAVGNGYQTESCGECDSEDLEYNSEGDTLKCLKCGKVYDAS